MGVSLFMDVGVSVRVHVHVRVCQDTILEMRYTLVLR